jgi:predicted protein tyrosine phosphatase
MLEKNKLEQMKQLKAATAAAAVPPPIQLKKEKSMAVVSAPPPIVAAATMDGEGEKLRVGIEEWTSAFDEVGNPYWYNNWTGESTYDDPNGWKEELITTCNDLKDKVALLEDIQRQGASKFDQFQSHMEGKLDKISASVASVKASEVKYQAAAAAAAMQPSVDHEIKSGDLQQQQPSKPLQHDQHDADDIVILKEVVASRAMNEAKEASMKSERIAQECEKLIDKFTMSKNKEMGELKKQVYDFSDSLNDIKASLEVYFTQIQNTYISLSLSLYLYIVYLVCVCVCVCVCVFSLENVHQ